MPLIVIHPMVCSGKDGFSGEGACASRESWPSNCIVPAKLVPFGELDMSYLLAASGSGPCWQLKESKILQAIGFARLWVVRNITAVPEDIPSVLGQQTGLMERSKQIVRQARDFDSKLLWIGRGDDILQTGAIGLVTLFSENHFNEGTIPSGLIEQQGSFPRRPPESIGNLAIVERHSLPSP